MIIIGERLNSSRKIIYEAMDRRDERFLVEEALKQEKAGASYIDLNASALVDREIDTLRWVVPLLQGELQVPLSIDTPNPEAMEEGLRIHRGRALLNSLTLEKEKLDAFRPLIKEFRPRVIALCLNEEGVPQSADQALARAERLADWFNETEVDLDDVFIDPLVRPASVEWESGPVFLESIEKIKKGLPGIRIIAGLSNVSFGLPQRKIVNRALLVLALGRGLDAAILDPNDLDIQAAARASEGLLGKDPYLKNYLAFVREHFPKPPAGA